VKPFKASLAALILVSFLGSSLAAAPPVKIRTIADIDSVSARVLQGSISPKFYKSLLISPIQGWVLVRGNLSGTHLSGIRVIHSELNGLYDPLALKLANEVQIAGYYSIDRPNLGGSILLHLLIYQIADGTMTLSFAHLDEPGGDQAKYYGCARLAVLRSDGKWTEIKGPEGLQGKGWAIRAAGAGNEFRFVKKLERIMGLTW
jgi:hypothetical protein